MYLMTDNGQYDQNR